MAELGKAYVQIVPSAKGIKGQVESILGKDLPPAGDSGGKKLGKSIVGKMKAVVSAAAIGKFIGSAITQGGKLQQSLGGVETLFKSSANRVKADAAVAFRTAGLSANDYMENVTSFAASLVSSLGGNTKEAARLANMAMVDMSDNANKMGTDLGSIQETYQSLARGNYAMLDNLKLGYGGTKSEMERLMKDAEKLTGEHYTVGDFADTVKAIHAVQKSMGITGTTAKEAATTLEGSFGMLKSSWTNFLGALSGESNIPLQQSIDDLIKSAQTFIENLAPILLHTTQNIGKSLLSMFNKLPVSIRIVTVAVTAATAAFKALKAAADLKKTILDGVDAFQSMGTGLSKLWGLILENPITALEIAIVAVVAALVYFFTQTKTGRQMWANFVQFLQNAWNNLVQVAQTVWNAIVQAFSTAVQAVQNAWNGITSFFTGLWNGIVQGAQAVWNGIVQVITPVVQAVQNAWNGISSFFSNLWQGIVTIATTLWNEFLVQIAPIVNAFKNLWSALSEFFSTLWTGIVTVATTIWNGLVMVFTTIWTTIQTVATTVWTMISTVLTTIWNTIVMVATTIWNGLVNIFTVVWNTIQTVATTVWTVIQTVLTTIWNAIVMVATTIWNGLVAVFTVVWNTIQTVVQTAITIVQTVIQTTLTVIQTIWNTVWTVIKTVAMTIWNMIRTIITTAINVIATVIRTITAAIQGNWSAVWNNIKTIASTIWNGIKALASSVFNAIKTVISTVWNAIKSITSTIWNGIKSTISNAMNGAKSAVSNAVDGIKSVLRGIGNVAKEATRWAQDLIDNFVGGIRAGIDRVRKAAGDVAGAVKKFLHFSEPDEGPLADFHTYAPDMMLGFATGIRKNIPLVRDAVEEMAAMTSGNMQIQAQPYTSSVSGFSSGHSSVNAPTTINVYGAKGQDVNQLADIVINKIDRDYKRKKAVI